MLVQEYIVLLRERSENVNVGEIKVVSHWVSLLS